MQVHRSGKRPANAMAKRGKLRKFAQNGIFAQKTQRAENHFDTLHKMMKQ